jgi:hypothetical protein
MEVSNKHTKLEDWEWGYFIDPSEHDRPVYHQQKPVIRYHNYMSKINELDSDSSTEELTTYKGKPYEYNLSRAILYLLCKALNWFNE